MNADEVKKIADNFNQPEIEKYFKEIYSKEKALENIINAAKEGFYVYSFGFDYCGVNPVITDNIQRLIIEDFIDYFKKLNYQVELGFEKLKHEYNYYPYLTVKWKKWSI